MTTIILLFIFLKHKLINETDPYIFAHSKQIITDVNDN